MKIFLVYVEGDIVEGVEGDIVIGEYAIAEAVMEGVSSVEGFVGRIRGR